MGSINSISGEKKGKNYKEVAVRVFATTLSTYYNWDNQNRPIIDLIERYFSKEELTEFLDTGKIEKLELIKDINRDALSECIRYKYNADIHSEIHAKIDALNKQNVETLAQIEELRNTI